MGTWTSLFSRALACRVFCIILLASGAPYPRVASAAPLPWPIFPPDANAGQIVQQCIELQSDLTQRMIATAFDLEAAAARYEQLYPAVRGDADSDIVIENGAVFPNPGVDTSDPDRFIGDPGDANTSELARLIDDLRSLQEQLSGLQAMYAIAVASCQEEIWKRSPQEEEPPAQAPAF